MIQSNCLAATLASITAAVLNLIAILILDAIWSKLALWLTNHENHRTETNYEFNLTLKVCRLVVVLVVVVLVAVV